MWPPKEVFWVVVAIKAAKASKETDRIIMATRISINVKPSDFKEYFNVSLLKIVFVWYLCKTHTNKSLQLSYCGKGERN
jgi:hypothetical protein